MQSHFIIVSGIQNFLFHRMIMEPYHHCGVCFGIQFPELPWGIGGGTMILTA
jgi:hypothetical protein